MIARLRGKLAEKEPSRVVIDVSGVGYEVFVPLTTFTAMPDAGNDVSVDIYTHVREDTIALFGFSSRQERRVFERLIGVSGIGPRLAVTILSGGSVESLASAIRRGDLAFRRRDGGPGASHYQGVNSAAADGTEPEQRGADGLPSGRSGGNSTSAPRGARRLGRSFAAGVVGADFRSGRTVVVVGRR